MLKLGIEHHLLLPQIWPAALLPDALSDFIAAAGTAESHGRNDSVSKLHG